MRKSIILKIFVAFLLVSLLPIGALIAYNDWSNRAIVYSMKIENIRKSAEKLALSIDRTISLRKERIVCVSKNCCLSNQLLKVDEKGAEECGGDSTLPKHCLKKLLNHFSPDEPAFILDTYGSVSDTNITGLHSQSYAHRDFFREAMKGNICVSGPAKDQGKGYLYYSAPVRDHANGVHGVLVMRRPAEELWELVEKEKDYLNEGSVCILTDKYGVRIAHAADRSLVFKSWVKLDQKIKKELMSESHYGDDIKEIGFTELPEVSDVLDQRIGQYFIHPLTINTENNHGYCMSLKEKDWQLIYSVPATTFFAQVRHVTYNAIFSTGIVVIVIVVITWVVSVKFLRPVKELTSAAHEIANGNLEYSMISNADDEIGKLTQAFNMMRHKLRDSYGELKESQIETIHMLAKACEIRDDDTGEHILRIGRYSKLIAKELGMNKEFIKELETSSILHDVGKLHIPDNILLRKQGGFTHEERTEMQKHPVYGDLVLGGKRFFTMAREVARWHHENWDGTGYPDGLKGEDIPISARIVRLADVYDALVMKRHYKDAWSDHEAYAEIVKHSGVFFDPQVVEAFKSLFARGLFQELRNK